jgi:hypothetical protein
MRLAEHSFIQHAQPGARLLLSHWCGATPETECSTGSISVYMLVYDLRAENYLLHYFLHMNTTQFSPAE